LAPPTEIHIAPGGSAGGLLSRILQPAPDGLFANNDLRSCGPLPPLESLAQWQRIREEYLRTIDDIPEFSFSTSARDLLTNAPALRGAKSIVLWVGSGLAEQLLLAWLVQLLRVVDVPVSRLAVIQFSRHPLGSGFEVFSVGLLNENGLAAHPPASPVSNAELARIDAAWAAVTAPTPELLLRFLSSPITTMPLLQRGLARLLQRFPDAATGLNHWERGLLRQVVDRGPTAARVIAHTMATGLDTGDLVGDRYLFARLRRMASAGLAHPLVALSGDTDSLFGSRVELTDAGRAAVAGKLNAVEANGIDVWVAGTHLDSRSGDVWFYRDSVLGRGQRVGGSLTSRFSGRASRAAERGR
jgi:Domain of unknown function (DUF1835)